MFIIVEFCAGDRGEWESIERTVGPFETQEMAEEWLVDSVKNKYLDGGVRHIQGYTSIEKIEST